METHEWTPKRRSIALGLIQGSQHSLSEISHIADIPKDTFGNLKKHNTPLNKVRSDHSSKLSVYNKCQIVIHITRNHESRCLSVMLIIQDLQLDISITRDGHKASECQPSGARARARRIFGLSQ